MSTAGDRGQYTVPGLVRGIQILRMFNPDRRVISAPKIAQELEIPRSTVFRLAQTLEQLGLLERVEHGPAYRLGIGLLGLGFELLASLDIAELGRPIVDALSVETGLSSHLVVREGRDVVVVYKAEGRSTFSGTLRIGSRLPAHATVLGRMILMDCYESELDELYGNTPLEAFTARTPISLDALRELLAADRARGYGTSDSFFKEGISGVAAPVRDHTGRAAGAINVTVLGRLEGCGGLDALIGQVRNSALRLSTRLDYRPPVELDHAR